MKTNGYTPIAWYRAYTEMQHTKEPTMAMSGRNTRAIHTEEKKTREALTAHTARMQFWMDTGMSKEYASKRAYYEVMYPKTSDMLWNSWLKDKEA